MTTQTNFDLPLTFRADVVKPIYQTLAAGDSCSVVGIGSVGKSNLLRFLRRDDVRQAQLGESWTTYLLVYIDINKILKLSRWGLFELMLHQLLIDLTNLGADQQVLETLDELHQRAAQPKTRYLALRHLDRAIRLVCHQLGLRLVFLFDEFDELCRRMAPEGFSALRALRDDYKYQVMYLVATRLELERLRDEIKEIEAFEELVTPHTFWLGPYSEADARFMLHRLASRHKMPLDEDSTTKILEATGSHPGLLREGYSVFRKSPDDFFDALVKSIKAQAECQRIWLSLSSQEQEGMLALTDQGHAPDELTDIIQRLCHKGLVRGETPEDTHIFSSIFGAYIRQQGPSGGRDIYIDHRQRVVLVRGHEIRGLTPLEYDLMAYLDEKRGELCTYDELAMHLYPEDMALEGAGVTDTRLHSLVKRLRRQIEPSPGQPRYILTVRGHGFRLADGDD